MKKAMKGEFCESHAMLHTRTGSQANHSCFAMDDADALCPDGYKHACISMK